MKKSVLVSDPGPLTARLMVDDSLPFTLTLLGNADSTSRAIVVKRKGPGSARSTTRPLDTEWPPGVISLSHIALPFPPHDPVYGSRAPEDSDTIFLGRMAIQGERGLLRFSSDWLLRLRHNPFYDYLEARTLRWLEDAVGGDGG